MMTTSFMIQEVAIPGTNMTVAFVFIDTIILAGKSDPNQTLPDAGRIFQTWFRSGLDICGWPLSWYAQRMA